MIGGAEIISRDERSLKVHWGGGGGVKKLEGRKGGMAVLLWGKKIRLASAAVESLRGSDSRLSHKKKVWEGGSGVCSRCFLTDGTGKTRW